MASDPSQNPGGASVIATLLLSALAQAADPAPPERLYLGLELPVKSLAWGDGAQLGLDLAPLSLEYLPSRRQGIRLEADVDLRVGSVAGVAGGYHHSAIELSAPRYLGAAADSRAGVGFFVGPALSWSPSLSAAAGLTLGIARPLPRGFVLRFSVNPLMALDGSGVQPGGGAFLEIGRFVF